MYCTHCRRLVTACPHFPLGSFEPQALEKFMEPKPERLPLVEMSFSQVCASLQPCNCYECRRQLVGPSLSMARYFEWGGHEIRRSMGLAP